MIRTLVALAILVAIGGLRLPIERNLTALHRHEHFRGVEFNLDLREQIGELGIKNNPDRPQLYEALARLYREKYKDHRRASEFYAKAAALSGAATYDRRFSAYELSYWEGHEREAYERLRSLYDEGEQERLPTLISRLKFLEDKLEIPQEQRIHENEGRTR